MFSSSSKGALGLSVRFDCFEKGWKTMCEMLLINWLRVLKKAVIFSSRSFSACIACLFLSSDIFASCNGFILPHWTKIHCYTKHIRPQAQIHYQEMLVPSRFIQRIYWQTSSAACFIQRESQRFYYIIMYLCHLLYCWWPVMGQVFTDHTCLYKQIMNQWYRLQILWDNMSDGKIKHYSSFKVFDITVYGFNVSSCKCIQGEQCGIFFLRAAGK